MGFVATAAMFVTDPARVVAVAYPVRRSFGCRLLECECDLTVNDPVPDGVLVVEGGSPDYALETAMSRVMRDGFLFRKPALKSSSSAPSRP